MCRPRSRSRRPRPSPPRRRAPSASAACCSTSTATCCKSLQNNVMREGLIFDPTAHGERQLIDWYFAERAKGRALPRRKTSPSSPRSIPAPCAPARSWRPASMWWWRRRRPERRHQSRRTRQLFNTLPAALRERGRRQLLLSGGAGFLAVFARDSSGATPKSFFIGKTIAEPTQALCSLVFEATSAEGAGAAQPTCRRSC
jgi:hypothetical protein